MKSARGVYGCGDGLCGKDSGKIDMAAANGEDEAGGGNNRNGRSSTLASIFLRFLRFMLRLGALLPAPMLFHPALDGWCCT